MDERNERTVSSTRFYNQVVRVDDDILFHETDTHFNRGGFSVKFINRVTMESLGLSRGHYTGQVHPFNTKMIF